MPLASGHLRYILSGRVSSTHFSSPQIWLESSRKPSIFPNSSGAHAGELLSSVFQDPPSLLRLILPVRTRLRAFSDSDLQRCHIRFPQLVTPIVTPHADNAGMTAKRPVCDMSAEDITWCDGMRAPQRPLPIAMVLLESYGSLRLLPAKYCLMLATAVPRDAALQDRAT